MGEYSFRLERVITLPEGALLEYEDDFHKPVYFYDANNNLQLDPADKKVVETPLGENRSYFTSRKVNSAEISIFGSQAKRMFFQARKEREELLDSFAPVETGLCYVRPTRNGYKATLANPNELTFEPPLKLSTQRINNRKYYSAGDTLVNKGSLDPSQCFMIHSEVMRKKIVGLPIRQEKIEVSTGDWLRLPVLEALDLKNGNALDVTYRILDVAERVHLDLTPPEPKTSPKQHKPD